MKLSILNLFFTGKIKMSNPDALLNYWELTLM